MLCERERERERSRSLMWLVGHSVVMSLWFGEGSTDDSIKHLDYCQRPVSHSCLLEISSIEDRRLHETPKLGNDSSWAQD